MRRIIFILMTGFILTGCTKKANVKPILTKATLVFPEKNAVCTQGTSVSATQSAITFKWDPSPNATSYSVTCKNLLTNTSETQDAGTNLLKVVLLVNTPYSWSVISKASTGFDDAKSDTWKFYNAGQATTNYAPFPAEANFPAMDDQVAAGNPMFKWTGSDADGDPLTYDFYCATDYNPVLIKGGLTNSNYADFTVKPGIYYWKIISRDDHGNASDSGVFQFTVK